jgi:hypothetical protein
MEIKSLKDKIKSESPFSGIAVPILIVVLSVVLVAGITRMLSSDKGYITLVEELRDKTFGNRWVAAFELSKYLASSQIPAEDIPWLENQLLEIYKTSESDPRTRNFLVLAAGSLQGEKSLELITLALTSNDPEILFAAISNLAKFKNIPETFSWTKVLDIADGKLNTDEVLQHTALVTLTHHKKTEVIPSLKKLYENSESKNLKDVVSIALMHFNVWDALDRIEYLLLLPYEAITSKENTENVNTVNRNQSLHVEANKLNIIQASKLLIEQKMELPERLVNLLIKVESNDQNIQVRTRAKEVLLILNK